MFGLFGMKYVDAKQKMERTQETSCCVYSFHVYKIEITQLDSPPVRTSPHGRRFAAALALLGPQSRTGPDLGWVKPAS